jgi:hypothetical protein
LQHKALGHQIGLIILPLLAEPFRQHLVQLPHASGGFFGDFHLVVAKDRFALRHLHKAKGGDALWKLGQGHRIDGGVDLSIEVVHPKLIEVAQHDVAGPIGHRPLPVVKGLGIVLRQIRAALFHFDQHAGLPHQVGEASFALFAALVDALFVGGPGFDRPPMAKGPKEAVEKGLGLAFFIPRQMF